MKKLYTDPYIENKRINSGPSVPTNLPSPVAGIYTSPVPTGYSPSGLAGVGPVPQYGQPRQSQPGLTGAYFPGATPIAVSYGGGQSQPAPSRQLRVTGPGTSGSEAVRQLQIQLNQQNAGKPGWIPLNVDGIMGPKTLAAQGFTSQATPGSAAAIAQQTGYTYSPNPSDVANQAEIDRLIQLQRDAANQTIDPNAVYQDALNRYQAQIDSINNIYNDMLVQSRTTNAPTYARRLGAGASLAVNQGLTGSNIGNSNISQIEQANQQEQLAAEAIINEQRAQKLADIMGQVRKSSESELAAKREAKTKGADSLLEYLKGAPERRAKKVSDAVKKLLSYKAFDSSNPFIEMTEDEIKSFTEGLGISREEFVAEFDAQYKKSKADVAKAEQDAMKALPAAAQEYEYAKKNGYSGSFSQYQNEDANRKARSSGGTKLTIGEQHAGVVSNLSQLFVPGASIPNSDGVPFVDNNGRATAEGWKTAMAAAQADGLPRKDFITQFGYLIAPGLESRYGITPAEIKLISGALPEIQ